jgi:16S rRNA processing protein RimM
MQPSEWLEIGKIVGVQGLKGEVRLYPDSDFPERFEQPGRRWLLRPDAAEPEPIELLSGRYIPNKRLYVLQFAGITDRTQAEALRDCRLLVSASDRPTLDEDEFHVLDLIGLEVFDQSTQALIGVVVNVMSAGNDLIEVERVTSPSLTSQPAEAMTDVMTDVMVEVATEVTTEIATEVTTVPDQPRPGRSAQKRDRSTVLIPFVKAIVPVVDLAQRRIEITPPPGLIES